MPRNMSFMLTTEQVSNKSKTVTRRSAWPERLYDIDKDDCIAEGFPEMSPDEFIEMFCESHKGCDPETTVNRIGFEYI